MTSSLPFDSLFQLVVDLPSRRPAPGLPRRLAVLFRELSQPRSGRSAEEIEDQIWALWVSHEDRAAEEIMAAAIEAMGAGSLHEAGPLLDELVARYPDWPEAWNKRATLASIEQRDADSLEDIKRTLELEPRHFGAISGFGQICLRHGHLNEARAAFQIALAFDPHLEALREILDDLAPQNLMLH
ncbi:hypothetical protein [Microvirga alba]|uniref:Tetratricopeptide repeat protein n=1 Tax=Microvirga alba TaxID=2791025 RepID=A0A931BNK9_9HYPH|nr:hypothetical protein [Microvirga alba]MBF9233248.1 hypothetical protein [Microvirga alba]